MEKTIPDKDFSGIGIIDFESWRPILRQNFGSLQPYRDVSYDIEKKRYWWWKREWVNNEARRRFEAAGREFMLKTLTLAKKMRPNALWGYYGYPQCFNRPLNTHPEDCANPIPAENDRILWLWNESTALFPSVYSSKDVTGERLAAFTRGRIRESERVMTKGTPILPYWWFRYRDGDYFKKEDLNTSFHTFYHSSASGFIIWGSSKDVNTKAKCINLRKYVTDVLGPTVAQYTKVINDDTSDVDPTVSTTKEPTARNTEQTTANYEPSYNDDLYAEPEETLDFTDRDPDNTSMKIDSNETSTYSILDIDIHTTESTSIVTDTDNPWDIDSFEDTSITNLNNNNFDETSTYSIDIDRTSTAPSTQEASLYATIYNLLSPNIPKLNVNDTSLTNFNVTTNASDVSSNNNSTEHYSLDTVSTTNVISNDTSPMNESSTEVPSTTASRPENVSWAYIYKTLESLSRLAKSEYGNDEGRRDSDAAASDFREQVVISVV